MEAEAHPKTTIKPPCDHTNHSCHWKQKQIQVHKAAQEIQRKFHGLQMRGQAENERPNGYWVGTINDAWRETEYCRRDHIGSALLEDWPREIEQGHRNQPNPALQNKRPRKVMQGFQLIKQLAGIYALSLRLRLAVSPRIKLGFALLVRVTWPAHSAMGIACLRLRQLRPS